MRISSRTTVFATLMLLMLSWAFPAAAAVDTDINDDCCPNPLADCCSESANWCINQTCGPAETSEENAGVCTHLADEFDDTRTVCVRQDQSQEPACVVYPNDTSCQHCVSGDTCMRDGQPVGTCIEADGRKDCSQSVTPTEAAAASPMRTPDLSVSIPGLELSKVRTTQEGQFRVYEIPWISDYIVGAYRYAVFLGSVLAAVMMMIGGLQWLTAAGDGSKVSKAKDRITNAIIGLVLILGTYVMLVTINPNLAELQPMRIKVIEKSAYSSERVLQTTTENTAPESEEEPSTEGDGEGE